MSKEVNKYEPTDEHIDLFNKACRIVEFEGIAIRDAIKKVGWFNDGFYKVLDYSTIYKEHYLRACEQRALLMAEDAINIFDKVPDVIIVNGIEQQNTIGLQKAKEKANNMKWHASKFNKVLSDKQENTTNIQVNGDVITWQGASNDNMIANNE